MDYLTTKTGKQFSKFTLQDYDGQFTFYAFSKSYDILRPLLYENQFLLLRCKIDKPRFGDREWELNIYQAEKMEDVKETYFNGLELRLNLKDLTPSILEDLEEIFKKFNGTSPVNINLYDQLKKYSIDMYSVDKRVNICQELMDELNRLQIVNKIIVNN